MMPRFLVTIERTWLETIERIVEADSKAAAKEQAQAVYRVDHGRFPPPGDWGPLGLHSIEYIVD